MSAASISSKIAIGEFDKRTVGDKGGDPAATRCARAEIRTSPVPLPRDGSDNAIDSATMQIVDRVATARLEAIAAWWRGARIVHFSNNQTQGLRGCWFTHPVLGMPVKIVQGVVSLLGVSYGISSVTAAAQFMETSGADIARITIIGAGEAGKPYEKSQYATHSYGGFYCTPVAMPESRELLRLGSDQELFLARLGRHTRRNIRRAERIADELGMQFSFQQGTSAFVEGDAVHRLALRSKPAPHANKQLAAFEAHIGGKACRFESRLLLASGELVSYSRGYIDNGVAYLIYQANDPIIPRINMSLLHRSKLIERLIGEGITEIIFLYGCGGLLGSACETFPVEEWVMIRSSPRGIFTALMLTICLPGTRIAKVVRNSLRASLASWVGQQSLGRKFQPLFSRSPLAWTLTAGEASLPKEEGTLTL